MNTDPGEYVLESNRHIDSFLRVFDCCTCSDNRPDVGCDCPIDYVAGLFWGVLVNVGVGIDEHVR
jgi:hypothetical protein